MRHFNLSLKTIPSIGPQLLALLLLFGDEVLMLSIPFLGVAVNPIVAEVLFAISLFEFLKLIGEKGGEFLLNWFCQSLPIGG